MKCAIYCRVSTIDKGQTLEQQEIPLIEYCKKEGWEFEIFKDFASGAKESRPQLDMMMQGVRSKRFQIVLVYRLDRLGRSLKHMLQLVEEFKNKNTRLIFFTQQIDTSTPQGMFFLHVLSAVSELERQLIRERIKDKDRYIVEKIKKDGFYLTKKGTKLTKRGRPTGSKDKKVRRKSGYNMRWVKERQKEHKKLTGENISVGEFENGNDI